MFGRTVLTWLMMVVLAIVNGTARDVGYGPFMTPQQAHQLSTVTLLLAFAGYVWFLSGRWPLASLREAVGIGLAWMVLTVGFEFALGRFGLHRSWQQLLAAYDLTSGNLWALVPIAVAVLPVAMYAIRRR
ncbi:hypothetical protein [Ramlibacter sp.]|uniref:hypothetical protein n=1 Tax=Ramlibacter sp. TaxID=1917967 RepID=UPI002C8170A3|nr:hypothetical protein [Ramlibacter sp.]HWI81338.1 hypothetical protein [Ramlibacter sp.]